MIPAMATKKQRKNFPQPEGPAVIRDTHVQDRHISHVAGAPKGWRDLSPLERAFKKGQLRGGSTRYTENQRFEAGQTYAMAFLIANGAGTTDSTQALNVSRSSNGFTPPQSQQDAIFVVGEIEAGMGARDCCIIRMVCGVGHEPVKAIQHVCADYQHTIQARFREALDSLIEAVEQYRRSGRVRKLAS